MDVNNSQYLEAYYALMLSVDHPGKDDGFNITRKEYVGGNFGPRVYPKGSLVIALVRVCVCVCVSVRL